MWKAFTKGIKEGVKYWRIALIVYVIQLLMAVTIGLQVYQVLEASIGRSLEIEKLMDGFDNTVFTDFLNVHGASITPLIGQLRYIILIYLLFSIFINSGILASIVNKGYSWKSFWNGAAGYFFSFFKITVFFLFVILAWSLLLWGPALAALRPGVENFASEVGMIRLFIIAAGIYVLGIIFIFNWQVASKVGYIVEKEGIWKRIKAGFSWTLRHVFLSTGLFLIFVFFQLVLITVYFCFGQNVGMTSSSLILFFLVFQQVLIYFRILWRIMLYSGIDYLVTGK